MFTADARFSVLHPEGDSSAWTLQLRGAQPQDQGLYECQVNTEPKMKQAVLLTVTGMYVLLNFGYSYCTCRIQKPEKYTDLIIWP